MGIEPTLTPNRHKIIEAILLLIEDGQRRGLELSQYDIVKSLFEADTAHLNAYGRPVTFDNYFALEHGPVPKEAYDMLKADYDWGSFGLSEAPWSARDTGPKTRAYTSRRRPNRRALSKTDQAALAEGLDLVLRLGFKGIRERTHKHPAWKKAWEERAGRSSKTMEYALLFVEPDPEAVEDLAYVSAHA